MVECNIAMDAFISKLVLALVLVCLSDHVTRATPLQATNGPLELVSSELTIIPDQTESLTLNCSFSRSDVQDNHMVISLTLARWNATDDKYEDLATINFLQPRKVQLLRDTGAVVSGAVVQTSVSYLTMIWNKPQENLAGLYKCESKMFAVQSKLGVSIKVGLEPKDTETLTETLTETVQRLEKSVGECLDSVEAHAKLISSIKSEMTAQQKKIHLLEERVDSQMKKIVQQEGALNAQKGVIDVLQATIVNKGGEVLNANVEALRKLSDKITGHEEKINVQTGILDSLNASLRNQQDKIDQQGKIVLGQRESLLSVNSTVNDLVAKIPELCCSVGNATNGGNEDDENINGEKQTQQEVWNPQEARTMYESIAKKQDILNSTVTQNQNAISELNILVKNQGNRIVEQEEKLKDQQGALESLNSSLAVEQGTLEEHGARLEKQEEEASTQEQQAEQQRNATEQLQGSVQNLNNDFQLQKKGAALVLSGQYTYLNTTIEGIDLHFYEPVSKFKTYTEARNSCRSVGGDLVEVTQDELQTATPALEEAGLKPNEWYWIGWTKKGGEWVFGSSGLPVGEITWEREAVGACAFFKADEESNRLISGGCNQEWGYLALCAF